MYDRVYIVLLNWNGWRDTVECLESVFRLDYEQYTVVVCDNNSSDDSLTRIKAWADGKYSLPVSDSKIRINHCFPAMAKPIRYSAYSREEAEAGGRIEPVPLVLIQTGGNLGFAGGNNVGIRFAQARADFAYIWLLNNDSVVHPHALAAMVGRMQATPAAGMCGSTVVYYHHPEKLQAQGGARYWKWLGMGRHIGAGLPVRQMLSQERVEQRMDYILGASLLVSRQFLEAVGLMNEEYFLYFEELDWALRAKGRFTLGYAPGSMVFHKEGGSIGTDSNALNRSLLSDYYLFRNRLIVTRKYFPWLLPSVYLRVAVAILTRAAFGRWENARLIGTILFRGK